MEREPAVAVRRAAALLLALGGEEALEHGGLGVKRLSVLTGSEISRVSRTLDVLSELELIERDPASQSYRLGWQLYTLAARAGEPQLRSAGARFVRLLTDELDERVHLSVLAGHEVLTILSESSAHTLQATGWVGRRHPYLYCSSAGRALLFRHSEEELTQLLGGLEFNPPGPNGPTGFTEFARRLALDRTRGWAYVDEEFEPGLVGVAAPVFDFDGRVIAALNVSGPKFRAAKSLSAAGPRLIEVAGQLSRLLGWSESPSATRRRPR